VIGTVLITLWRRLGGCHPPSGVSAIGRADEGGRRHARGRRGRL